MIIILQCLRGSPSQVNGAALRAHKQTFNFDEDTIKSFLSRLEAVGRSEGRIKKLKRTLNRYGKFVDWTATLENTTKYIKKRGEKVAKKTLADDVQAVKQFLSDYGVLWSEKLQRPNPPRKRPKIVERKDILNFIDRLMEVSMKAEKYNFRAKTAVVLSAVTGMRAFEVYRLDWSDINIEDRYIDLPAVKTKTKEQRYVIFNEEAQKDLRKLRELFPDSSDAFHRKIIRYLIGKMEKKPEIKFKHCRKFFSQEWDRRDKSTAIKEMLLGHFGSIDLSNYNNQRVEDLREVYDSAGLTVLK